MSDAVHLLIPCAAPGGDAGRAATAALALPTLERLLARLSPAEEDACGETALSTPGERALARLCGLAGADGALPWAAWAQARSGQAPGEAAWARITPCHWQVGTDHIRMHDPQQLQLAADDSQALLAAVRPYFEQDGLALDWRGPTHWVARGPLFDQLALASLDRVAGRVLDPWIPRGPEARPLRRLQQEMQMLLYTHPVNDARQQAGLPPVNSFWADGPGALPVDAPPPAGLEIVDALREPALLQDWPAWTAAWRQLDAGACARLLAALDAGRPVALTLCGDSRARTWRSAGAGALRRLAALWSRPRAATLLATL
jgi:hypothetical protein